MSNQFLQVASEYKEVVSVGELHDILQAFKTIKDESGKGSITLVLEAGNLRAIETVIKRPDDSDEPAIPIIDPIKAQRRAWRRYASIPIRCLIRGRIS